jgi:hypothetical protein
VLQKIWEPQLLLDDPIPNGGILPSQVNDEVPKSDASSLLLCTNYSNLFGEEFSLSENHFDVSFLNILDISAVEEGILHLLYAAASQVIFVILYYPYIFKIHVCSFCFILKGWFLFS